MPFLNKFFILILALNLSCGGEDPSSNEVTLSIKVIRNSTSHVQNKLSQFLDVQQQNIPSPPASISNFDCLFFNVIGSGIPAHANFNHPTETIINNILNGSSYCSYPGIHNKPILFSGNTTGTFQTNLTIPTGDQRIVQAIGVVDESPDKNFCNTGNFEQDPYKPGFYVLSQNISLIVKDTTISLPTNFNSLSEVEKISRLANCSIGSAPVASTGAVKLKISTTPSVIAGSCTPINIYSQNSNNDDTAVTENKTIQLNSTLSGTFYTSSPDCATPTNPITNKVLNSGSYFTTVYFRLDTSSSPIISVTDSSSTLTGDSLGMTVTAATPSKIVITGPSTSTNNVCNPTPLQLNLQDVYGNPTLALTDTTVSNISLATKTLGTDYYFYSDSSCTITFNPTNVTVLTGNSISSQFYLKTLASSTGTNINIIGTGGLTIIPQNISW